MLGLGAVMLGLWAITWYFSTKAGATMLGQTTPALKADDIVNPLNTVWVLVAAFLVFIGRNLLKEPTSDSEWMAVLCSDTYSIHIAPLL